MKSEYSLRLSENKQALRMMGWLSEHYYMLKGDMTEHYQHIPQATRFSDTVNALLQGTKDFYPEDVLQIYKGVLGEILFTAVVQKFAPPEFRVQIANVKSEQFGGDIEVSHAQTDEALIFLNPKSPTSAMNKHRWWHQTKDGHSSEVIVVDYMNLGLPQMVRMLNSTELLTPKDFVEQQVNTRASREALAKLSPFFWIHGRNYGKIRRDYAPNLAQSPPNYTAEFFSGTANNIDTFLTMTP